MTGWAFFFSFFFLFVRAPLVSVFVPFFTYGLAKCGSRGGGRREPDEELCRGPRVGSLGTLRRAVAPIWVVRYTRRVVEEVKAGAGPGGGPDSARAEYERRTQLTG